MLLFFARVLLYWLQSEVSWFLSWIISRTRKDKKNLVLIRRKLLSQKFSIQPQVLRNMNVNFGFVSALARSIVRLFEFIVINCSCAFYYRSFYQDGIVFKMIMRMSFNINWLRTPFMLNSSLKVTCTDWNYHFVCHFDCLAC